MKRISVILLLTTVFLPLRAQVDSTKLAAMDKMLDNYIGAMEKETADVKSQECDFIISSCTDSLLKQNAALHLYTHYFASSLMGDEAVAIHIYDNWFADGKVKMQSDIDLLNAGIFAEFNRTSLIGAQAPVLEMKDIRGEKLSFPVNGRYSVLFFYDTTCSRCKLETSLLGSLLDSGRFGFSLYAVYVGDDRSSWEEYAAENLRTDAENISVQHLWDPQIESGYQKLYGVMQTPRMFLVAPDGRIVGRMLNTEALIKLLIHYEL